MSRRTVIDLNSLTSATSSPVHLTLSFILKIVGGTSWPLSLMAELIESTGHAIVSIVSYSTRLSSNRI